MKEPAARFSGTLPAALVLAATLTGCGGASRTSPGVAPAPAARPALTPAEVARADSGRPPYTRADADFMSGMIGHHAQAIVMAGWASSHGASASVRALCERIVVGQRDEIASMQRWLRDRHEPVPDADPRGHLMPGMDEPMLMPGMLTPAQMMQLDAARGIDFDRLFLRFMIQHHQGAIAMVERLMASRGAAQDDVVFKFAADVNVDQTTEIDRMTLMLAALPRDGGQ
jgi:uncharacterized protein (DUF305 family)